MSIKTTSKVAAAVLGFSMTVTAFAAVGALAASAQAMTLTQLVNLFIQMGIISPDKAQAALAAVNTPATTATFSTNLTVGSKGADVTALQTALGVTATGYFGSITKAAVVAYQTAHSLPATGFVGPLTRAALNGSSASMTTTTTTTTTASTPSVNTGVEGILSVDQASVSNSTVYVGQTKVPVLSFKATAKLSPITLERVQLDLGANTTIYTKVFKTIYLMDPSGNVLAQADLNSNTVVKSGGVYLLTLGGFNYAVPKDVPETLTVAADLYSAVDTLQQGARTISLDANGIRGTDGAGIDQYGPATGFSQTVTVSASLTDSAQLLLSTDAANFLPADVVAAAGAGNNQYDKLPILAFDVRAQKDTVEITDLTATVSSTGTGNATATAAYLYDGSTLLGSASVNSSTGVAKFSTINYWVPQDTTKVLTLKADIRNAAATVTTFSATVAANGPAAQNSQGSTVSPSGTATSNNFTVRSVGPVFTLVSSPITKSVTASQNSVSTSTADATFTLTIQAVGGDIYFGTQAASSTFQFGIYQNGVKATILDASTTAWSNPSTGAVTTGVSPASFKISQNNSVTMPIDFIFEGRTAAGIMLPTGSYAVGLEGVNWGTTAGGPTTASSFFSGQTSWRTSAISLP